MAQKLLRKVGAKRKVAPKKATVDAPKRIVLVGTYAARQLENWPGYYNYPLYGKDRIDVEAVKKVMSVAAFSRERGMSAADAYCYLDKYSGMSFLDEHYSMSRCYSEEMMDESLSKVCRNHGGTLK